MHLLMGVGGKVAGEERPASVLSLDALSFVQSEKLFYKYKSIFYLHLYSNLFMCTEMYVHQALTSRLANSYLLYRMS